MFHRQLLILRRDNLCFSTKRKFSVKSWSLERILPNGEKEQVCPDVHAEVNIQTYLYAPANVYTDGFILSPSEKKIHLIWWDILLMKLEIHIFTNIVVIKIFTILENVPEMI